MNSKEIRETIVRHAENHNPGTAEQNIAFWLSSSAQFLAEIAQQLAEQNEKLNILLYHPLAFNVDIGPNERMGFDSTFQPIFMPMEPKETLRDKFAMAVLQGYISCDPTGSAFWQTIPQMQDAAKRAYEWAAVMMEARK